MMNEAHAAMNIHIHGIRIDKLNMMEASERIFSQICQRSAGIPSTVFTPNAEIIYRCSADNELSSLVNSGDINVPDGVGALWAAKLLGTPLFSRVPGVELGEAVLKLCAATKAKNSDAEPEEPPRIFLLGGKPGVAAAAARKLRARFPGLNICGTHHGYYSETGIENAEVIKKINSAAPELLIVCQGFPRQERWIIANRTSLSGVRVMMALGGSLDVWSGNVRRAPSFMRQLGLEWLWRIATSPSRLRRVFMLPAFIRLTLREKRNVKRARQQFLL